MEPMQEEPAALEDVQSTTASDPVAPAVDTSPAASESPAAVAPPSPSPTPPAAAVLSSSPSPGPNAAWSAASDRLMLQSARAHGAVVAHWPDATIARLRLQTETAGQGETQPSSVSAEAIQERLLTLIDLIKQQMHTLTPPTQPQQSAL